MTELETRRKQSRIDAAIQAATNAIENAGAIYNNMKLITDDPKLDAIAKRAADIQYELMDIIYELQKED